MFELTGDASHRRGPRRQLRAARAASIAALSAVLLAGCPRMPPTPMFDSGPPRPLDAGLPPPRVDTDGDGLCDDFELERGTDPEDTDSDDDGFGDGTERQFMWLPLDPTSPERDTLIFMTEGVASAAQLPIFRIVRGEGETFSGGFSAPIAFDRLGIDASDFFEGALAVGALPAENVFEVRAEDQQFIGVVGRTQLTFEVRFAFGENLERGCGRVYPFRYEVRRDDGVTVLLSSYALVVIPRGQRLENVVWCVPEDGCL